MYALGIWIVGIVFAGLFVLYAYSLYEMDKQGTIVALAIVGLLALGCFLTMAGK